MRCLSDDFGYRQNVLTQPITWRVAIIPAEIKKEQTRSSFLDLRRTRFSYELRVHLSLKQDADLNRFLNVTLKLNRQKLFGRLCPIKLQLPSRAFVVGWQNRRYARRSRIIDLGSVSPAITLFSRNESHGTGRR